MDLNADFDVRVAMHSDSLPWQASPMKGVDRRMLDRLGDEVARATTIVRYAPNSHFSPHVHTGGEEFIVLEGVFQDEHGDYPVGSYVRNPPTSSHTPRSAVGCVIFVKLWQFDTADRQHVNIDMFGAESESDVGRPGVDLLPLFKDAREDVRLETYAANTDVSIDALGGAELLMLDGEITESGEVFGKHDWLRVPDGYVLTLKAGEQGAKVWVKTGHLRYVTKPSV